MAHHFLTLLRWLWAAMFVLNGLMMLLSLVGLVSDPFVQPMPEAQAWYANLFSAPFLTAILGLAFLVGGLCLFLERTTPLGLVLITGPVAVIVAYHLTMTGLVAWSLFTAAVQLALLWRYRAAFVPLWTYSPAERPLAK